MRFALVLLHIPCIEWLIPRLRGVLEFRLSSRLEIGWIVTQLVVGAYLIQRILISHVLIFRKINRVSFLSKSQ